MDAAQVAQLAQEIDALIDKRLRFVPGQKAGLAVRIGHGGVYLSSLDISGYPINFTDEHRHWMRTKLLARFTNLDLRGVLGRSSETGRRFNSVAKRLELIQERVKNGDVIALESLDFQGTHARLNTQGSLLTSETPRDITRGFTYVRLKPEPATRVIILSDLPLSDPTTGGRIIPDEVIIQYPISEDELKAVRTAKAPATFTPFLLIDQAQRKASKLKIHCGDINLELMDDKLVDHFIKTMRGLVAAIYAATSRFGITPEGRVSGSVTDSYLHSAEGKFSPEHATLQRRTASGAYVRALAEFDPELSEGERIYKPVRPATPFFSANLSAQVRKKIAPEVNRIAGQIETLLNRMPKK
jgi:hypothetical protein